VNGSLPQRLLAEAIGTAFLLAIVIGSGIMGERLSNGIPAIALLANSIATGCGLAVMILTLAPVSGAHFNPLVTVAFAFEGDLAWKDVAPYVAVQILAAFAGVAAANVMFEEALFSASTKVRTGGSQWLSEAIATFGLFLVVLACSRRKSTATPWAIGAYITSAYWFTSSTSFANPAVTLARSASNTFAGIRPDHLPGFVAAQLVGAFAGWLVARRLQILR
jgi:glycerol uptake facilitator-like aquaporin